MERPWNGINENRTNHIILMTLKYIQLWVFKNLFLFLFIRTVKEKQYKCNIIKRHRVQFYDCDFLISHSDSFSEVIVQSMSFNKQHSKK